MLFRRRGSSIFQISFYALVAGTWKLEACNLVRWLIYLLIRLTVGYRRLHASQ